MSAVPRWQRELDRLVANTDRQWRRRGRALDALPAVAAAALRDVELDAGELVPIAAHLALRPRLAHHQHPVGFGDAQVTVAQRGNLIVQLIYWLDQTTTIHQHGFAGAFRVMTGASLHTAYDFHEDYRERSVLCIGSLTSRRHELLGPGAIREIAPGAGLIHNLFHLEEPSVTLTVRTLSTDALKPQWSYHLPGLGIDPFHIDADLDRKIRLFDVVWRLKRRAIASQARSLIALGLFESWELLGRLHHLGPERTQLERLFPVIRDVHGERGARLVDAFVGAQMRSRLASLRRQVRDRGHRMLLAVLGDASDRTTIVDLLARAYPRERPRALLERWLLDLAGPFELALERDDVRAIGHLFAGTDPRAVAREIPTYTTATLRALKRGLQRSMFAALVRDAER